MKFWLVRLVSIVLAIVFSFGLESVMAGQSASIYRLVVLAGLYITLAVSLNLINGITGQFSIGHAAFYMVGAYSAGFVSKLVYASQPLGPQMWLIVAMIVGGVFAGIAGFVVGLPSLRLRGDYLAIVTLGFGEILRIIVQNVEPLGGAYGMNIKPFGAPPHTMWLVWLLAILCVAVCRNLLKTAHGLPFLAVREDEVASAAMGVKVPRTKVTAFVVGSAFAGAAGAILGHAETFISPDTFKMDVSFIILTMVVLGGTGSITGSVIAAVALFAIPEWLRNLQDPTGAAIQIPGPALVASILAVIVAVALFKFVQDRYHGEKIRKIGLYVGAVLAGVVVQFALAKLFGNVPQLAAKSFEAAALRMVIFAATLIILMLLRPQGMLAHHELSWNWIAKILGLKKREVAQA